MTDVIRRKIDRARPPPDEGAPGADRGWRLGLARAARDLLGLDITFRAMSVTSATLPEILEIAPDRSLVALLDGPGAGLGVLFLSPDITAALIEMQTMGRLSPQAATPRKPTRIDAAMVAGLIDRALIGLEEALTDEADQVWAAGFRYASHLEDARPLALLLEEESYRLLMAEIGVGGEGRAGQVVLVLPARGRGRLPVPESSEAQSHEQTFALALADQVLQAESRLEAVISRLRLPLGRVMALAVDDELTLPLAALDAVALETLEGRLMARARLGQHRGMRAVKLGTVDGDAKLEPVAPIAASPPPEQESGGEGAATLRAAG